MKTLVSLISILFFTSLPNLATAQKVGFQFYQGVNKPIISFESGATKLDYTSSFNSDTRLGIWIGDLDKVSVSTLIGASSTQATYSDDDVSSSFDHSSLIVDIPVRYSFISSPINSIANGPLIGVLMFSSQQIKGIPITENLSSGINYSFLEDGDYKQNTNTNK